jgi:ATP-dependent Clp protease ATP-binding subunit ClpB
MLDRLTIKAQEALELAAQEARKFNHPDISPSHILKGLISQKDGVVPPLLNRLGVTIAHLDQQLQELYSRVQGPMVTPFSKSFQQNLIVF